MPLGGSDQRLLEAASGDALITTETTGLGLARVTGGWGGGSGDGRQERGYRRESGEQKTQRKTESSDRILNAFQRLELELQGRAGLSHPPPQGVLITRNHLLKLHVKKHLLLLAALFMRAQNWKQSADEWINEMWHSHTWEYYQVQRGRQYWHTSYNVDEPWKHYVERSQMQKTTCYMMPLVFFNVFIWV